MICLHDTKVSSIIVVPAPQTPTDMTMTHVKYYARHKNEILQIVNKV